MQAEITARPSGGRRATAWLLAAALPLGAAGMAMSAKAETVDVVYGVYADAEDLDPHSARGSIADHIVTIALFDPLIWDFDASKPEGEMSGLRPMLAESWEIVDDHTWRLHLRQGVVFHNGAPFNAEAVKFSIERPHQPGFETGDKIIDVPISHVEIIDDYTVDIVTHEPVPILPQRLTRNGAFILEPGHYADLSQDESSRMPVGTGPFKLVEWQRDQRIVLERNEDYWGKQPNFDRLVFRVVPEPATMLVEALTGEIDIAPVAADMVDEVDNTDGVHVVIGDSLVRATLIVNVDKHEALQDPRVRQAMQWAIDTQALIDAYALGRAQQSVTMVSPPYEGTGLEPYGYDPARAKELLAEAGWEDGFQIELDVAHPDAFDWAEAAAFFLGEVGIEITQINMLARSVFVERNNEGTLNLHAHHWSAGENTPETDMWATHPDRPSNSTNWFHQEWYDLYAELVRTVDPDRRAEINDRLQEILYYEGAWLPQYRIPLIKAVSDRVEGYHPHPSFLVEDYANIRVVD
jgi:peptide/nickel transport system substrate-binding protein